MIICDPILWGEEHAPFNAGLIQVAAAADSGALAFWAEASHIEAVRRLLPDDVAGRVAFTPTETPPRVQDKDARVRGDAMHAWRMVRAASAAGSRHLIFAGALQGNLIGAKIAGLALGSRRPATFSVIHGSLAEVWGWRSRNPLRRMFDMAGALAWPAPSDFRLLILEAGIADALAARISSVARQIVVLEHPIAETLNPPATRRPGPMRLGFLGLASRAKGFDRYCELATLARGRGATAEFHAIGMADPGRADEDGMDALATRPQRDKLSRADFVERLCDLDMVVMTHDPAHYAYSPSGVLLDALAAERPVLSLPNPLVDAIAERYGPIGPSVANLEEAAAFVAGLDEAALAVPPFTDYRVNLSRAAAGRRPAALAAELAKVLWAT